MGAVDRLLTDENAERHGPAWLTAATETALLMLMARGVADTPLCSSASRTSPASRETTTTLRWRES